MEAINLDSENILILALTGSVLFGAWLAYKLKLFSTINDEKKILLPSFLFLLSPFLLPFIFSHNMLSESTGINYLLSGTLSSVITGVFLIINTQRMSSVNNNLQLEREEQQRIWQEKNNRETWYREKIYDSYKISIQTLTRMIQEDFTIAVLDNTNDTVTADKRINLVNLKWKFDAEFSIIKSAYPYKDYEEFKEKISMIEEHLDKTPIITRVIVLQLMEKDTRIKV
jgi:hypothetical protein